MNLENKKTILLLSVIIFSLAFYLLITNHIETERIYPNQVENWFTFEIADYGNDRNCIELDQINIYYRNDIFKGDYVKSNKEPNLLELHITIKRKCKFENAKIEISASDLSFPIYLEDKNEFSYINKTGNESFDIVLTNESDLRFQVINVLIPIKKEFYNYYRFNARDGLNFNVVSFTYKNSFFGGYLADDSSFVILDGKFKDERPIFSGKYKWYLFDDQSIILRFNPRSKFWFLFQKLLDALVLGMIVVALYDFPWKNLKKTFRRISKKLKGFFRLKKMQKERMSKLDEGSGKTSDKLWKRLNEIEQEINLSTLDNTIFTLMILIFSISLPIVITSLLDPDRSPNLFIFSLIAVMIIVPLIQLFLGYINSMIFKRYRFSNKINIITIFSSLLIFVILLGAIPLILEKYLPVLDQGNSFVSLIILIVILGFPIAFAFYLYPKIKRFFLYNYPNLFLKLLLRMTEEDKKKVLKSFKIKLPELKKLADNY